MTVRPGDIKSLNIGCVSVYPPILQAPMAGITDMTFRVINRRAGCPMVCAEMISDKALTYGSKATRQMLRVAEEERPISIQLFGSEPEVMGRAAAMVAEISRPEVLDINMGCPAPKVVRNREGCALMKHLPLAASIIKSVVESASSYSIPVTVKMRLGWSREELAAVELGRIAESEGAAAVVVHGRTREEYYSGRADWDGIGQVKAALNIPVIGNGDVRAPEDAAALLRHTGCDGVMIGRGALGNPWLFTRTNEYLINGVLLDEPTPQDRLQMAMEHARMLTEEKGEHIAVREMRKHLAWYMKGMHGSARFREAVNSVCSLNDISLLIHECLKIANTK